MKTVLKIFGYIIAVLLMAAGLIGIVAYIMGLGSGNDPLKDLLNKVNGGDTAITTTMSPVESTTPAPDGNTVLENTQQNGTSSVTKGTPTPVPTATPSPTPVAETEETPAPSPDVTPEPTPAPTPEAQAQPAGTSLGGGTLSSNTGKWIDVDAVWTAEVVNDAQVKVTVTANLRSYGLYIGAKVNGLEMSVGDEGTAMDTDAIVIETEQEVTTKLGSYDFVVEAPAGKISLIPVKVNWHFGGTYSGKQIDVITAEGNITIER